MKLFIINSGCFFLNSLPHFLMKDEPAKLFPESPEYGEFFCIVPCKNQLLIEFLLTFYACLDFYDNLQIYKRV